MSRTNFLRPEFRNLDRVHLYAVCVEHIEVLEDLSAYKDVDDQWVCVLRWYAGDDDSFTSREFVLNDTPGPLEREIGLGSGDLDASVRKNIPLEFVSFLVARAGDEAAEGAGVGDEAGEAVVLALSFANADHIAVALQVGDRGRGCGLKIFVSYVMKICCMLMHPVVSAVARHTQILLVLRST